MVRVLTMANEITQPAFVLHRKPYRETSLLVTFFTPDYGKVSAVIKGVRAKNKSAKLKQAWLQPFQALEIRWKEKSVTTSDLVSVWHYEPLHLSFPLSGEASICGMYCNELLYRLSYAYVGAEGLYQLYRETLLQLSKQQVDHADAALRSQLAWRLRLFEKGLLNELGAAVVFSEDMDGRPLASDRRYRFAIEKGFYESNQKNAVLGQCLLNLTSETFQAACLPELKYLFREILSHYLGDGPVMARRLFN